MKELQAYALERHLGPYESWPSRTALLLEGRPTGTNVPGHGLLHQWELADGRRLLITDMDCPWEEETHVLLLDAGHHLLARTRFGLPWGFYLLAAARPVGPACIELTFASREGLAWRVEVLDQPTWLLGSLLRCSRAQAPEPT